MFEERHCKKCRSEMYHRLLSRDNPEDLEWINNGYFEVWECEGCGKKIYLG